MKPFIILVPYLLISSCYVYNPTSSYDTVIYTSTSTEESFTTLPVKQQEPVVKSSRDCKKINFPDLKPAPIPPTIEEITQADSQAALDAILRSYIEALREHNEYQADVIIKCRLAIREC